MSLSTNPIPVGLQDYLQGCDDLDCDAAGSLLTQHHQHFFAALMGIKHDDHAKMKPAPDTPKHCGTSSQRISRITLACQKFQ